MKQHGGIGAARLAGALLAAATLLVAALLVAQCADIYRVGTSAANMTQAGVRIEDIFSRAVVSEKFGRIAWAFVLWAALWVWALIAKAVSPAPARPTPAISPESRLERTLLSVAPTDAMRAEERKRAVASALCAAVCAACAAATVMYFCDLNRFASRDLERVVGAALLYVAPWAIAAFAALIVTTRYCGQSRLRELETAKTAPKEKRASPARKPGPIIAGRIALYAAAAALIIAGVLNGGMYDVLVKAVNICTECIGLG